MVKGTFKNLEKTSIGRVMEPMVGQVKPSCTIDQNVIFVICIDIIVVCKYVHL